MAWSVLICVTVIAIAVLCAIATSNNHKNQYQRTPIASKIEMKSKEISPEIRTLSPPPSPPSYLWDRI
jgi:hypothetical protein